MLILGIDPGSRFCGFGLIKHERNTLSYVDSGRFALAPATPLAERLSRLHGLLTELVHRHRPDAGAVEKIFFAKSVQSALSLGQARGVVLAALSGSGIPVMEYSALEIKKSVVGYGKAGKGQVQAMVRALLGLRQTPLEDEADALATAICHAHSSRLNPRAQAKALR